MAIPQHPRFKKNSWVIVQHNRHPFDGCVGRVAIAGNDSCEVDFFMDGRAIRKPLMNRWLAATVDPLSAQG